MSSEPGEFLTEGRAPVMADPSLAAWCSFCCRPGAEVGSLIAGPNDAFICGGCVREAAELLSKETLRVGPRDGE